MIALDFATAFRGLEICKANLTSKENIPYPFSPHSLPIWQQAYIFPCLISVLHVLCHFQFQVSSDFPKPSKLEQCLCVPPDSILFIPCKPLAAFASFFAHWDNLGVWRILRNEHCLHRNQCWHPFFNVMSTYVKRSTNSTYVANWWKWWKWYNIWNVSSVLQCICWHS